MADDESARHMDEFERVSQLAQVFAQQNPTQLTGVQRGIGDDAAVLAATALPLVLSVDVAVENVHFKPEFASWRTLGARAFTAAISDLAAMAATPSAALSALIIPAGFSRAAFSELNAGIAAAALAYGCPVVGGNLSSGSELSITTTVIGCLRNRGLYRDAAKPGDHIYVTGPLGSAALGLLLLQRGEDLRELEEPFVQAWRAPQARITEALGIADRAHAAIDISDGALQDLGHICAASGVGAELETARIPYVPGFRELASALGRDPLALALLGGEDYELIYTLPPAAAAGPGTRIGRIVEQPGAPVLLDEHGRVLALEARGFRHF
ncbi:MAG: hypothetical protein RL701_4501 [Pseudomonadota bacterium]|jgi:thiamine-monophosphate kinase